MGTLSANDLTPLGMTLHIARWIADCFCDTKTLANASPGEIAASLMQNYHLPAEQAERYAKSVVTWAQHNI